MTITVSGLSKRFGATRALDDVSFTVRDNEVLGLIGPNGSGKSTLFECLAGLLHADAGTITDGEATLAPRRRRRSLFYVPDGITPWPDQTVGFVLQLAKNLYAAHTGKRAQVIESLRLRPLLTQRVGELSKGQRKRVLLAFGLITSHPLLLLDEPFDGLDLRQTRDVTTLLRAEAALGRTLFLSIHQLGDAIRVCDRLILLADGRVVGDGTLDELRATTRLADGTLEDVFLALTEPAPR